MKYVFGNLSVPVPEFHRLSKEEKLSALESMKQHVNQPSDQKTFEQLLSGELRGLLLGKDVMLVNDDAILSIALEASGLGDEDIPLQQGGYFNPYGPEQEHPCIVINTHGLDAMDITELDETIRHELIHYEQFARGDLKFAGTDIIWRNVVYSIDYVTAQTRHDYAESLFFSILNLPWEYEAYRDTPQIEELKVSDPEWYARIQRLYESPTLKQHHR